MGGYSLWNYVKNSYLFDKFAIDLVALQQEKVVNWVIMQVFLCLYFVQILSICTQHSGFAVAI